MFGSLAICRQVRKETIAVSSDLARGAQCGAPLVVVIANSLRTASRLSGIMVWTPVPAALGDVPDEQLSGRNAVVTGAKGDIGAAVARELANRGARVRRSNIGYGERSDPTNCR